MKKKGPIIGGIIAVLVVAIITSVAMNQDETINLDMQRSHGTISTAMGSPLLGNPDAKITIVEFGDYQCHQCFNWFHNTKPTIVENYIDSGKANLIFMDLAVLGRDSITAAQATYCAEEQGKYWEYHRMLYDSQQKIDDGWANSERLQAFAFTMGLDIELFDSCMDSGKYSKRVQYNVSEARKAGAAGTPTFFIVDSNGNQQKITGAQPYSVFQTVLDSMI